MEKVFDIIKQAILIIKEEEWAILTDIRIDEFEQEQYKYVINATISKQRESFDTKIGKTFGNILLIEKGQNDELRDAKVYTLIDTVLFSKLNGQLILKANKFGIV